MAEISAIVIDERLVLLVHELGRWVGTKGPLAVIGGDPKGHENCITSVSTRELHDVLQCVSCGMEW